MLNKVNCTETCSLRTEDRTTPSETLTGENSCIVLLSELLVHTVHITDLASAYSDVACRYVLIWTDHLPKLKHKCLAEAHNFSL